MFRSPSWHRSPRPRAAGRVAVAISLALILSGLAAAPLQARLTNPPPGAAGPAIVWSDSTVEVMLDPGSQTTLELSFTAKRALTNITVGTTRAIADFATVDRTVRALEVGQVVDVDLTLTVPPDTPMGTYRGSVFAYRGLAHVARPVLVTLIVGTQRYMYWAAADMGPGVGRAFVNGAGIDNQFVAVGGFLRSAAATSSHVYWANVSDGWIGRATRVGTGVDEDFIALPEGWHPRGLATTTTHVYWVAFFTVDGSGVDPVGRIGRAKLDGTEIDHDFMTVADSPASIAVGQTRIYWTATDVNEIRSANKDGTNIQNFVGGVMADDLAVDDDYLYWINGKAQSIARVGLNGTGLNLGLVSLPAVVGEYSGLAVDSQYLYYISYGDHFIGRVNRDGTNPNHSFITEISGADVAVEPD
jgi:hypothetical protein